jgi:peptide/nickel transport system substrate-binding protein
MIYSLNHQKFKIGTGIMQVRLEIDRRSILFGLAAAATPGLRWQGAAVAADNVLRAAITGYSPMSSLDPAKASVIAEFQIIWGLYETLLDFDEQMNIVPGLAESYRTLGNGDVEFKLRKGVKFHDGGEMNAEDVVFSLSRLKDPAVASPYASKLEAVKEIVAVDEHTVRLALSQPFAPLFTFLTNTRTGTQIISKKAMQRLGEAEFGRNPVGTGPFRLTEWKPNQSLTLAMHKDYHRQGLPKIATLQIPLIKELASGVNALLGNQVDIISEAPYADLARFADGKQAVIKAASGLNTRFVLLNNKKPPFDDPHFRRALSMAFDRKTLIEAALFGQAQAAHGPIPGGLAWAYDSAPSETGIFDPDRARAELAKSKYGKDATANILTWGSDTWRRFAEIFVAQTNDVLGTKLKLEVSEASTVTDRIRKKQFDAAVWGWKGFVDPDEYLECFQTNSWRNDASYANPEFDEIAGAARAEMDQKKRRELCIKASQILSKDCPVLFAYCENVASLARPSVQGLTVTPFGGFGAQLAAVSFS